MKSFALILIFCSSLFSQINSNTDRTGVCGVNNQVVHNTVNNKYFKCNNYIWSYVALATGNFITGQNDPDSTIGLNNDLFLNTTSGNLFGPKADNSWGTAIGNVSGSNGLSSSGCSGASGTITCPSGFTGGSGPSRITLNEGITPPPPSGGQQTLYIDSGDHTVKAIDTNSTVTTLQGSGGGSGGNTLTNPSLGATALTTTIANENNYGTTNGFLTELINDPPVAILAHAGDGGGVIGVTVSGGGRSGNAEVAISGQTSCIFDGAATAGDYVGLSSINDGNCTDTGSSYPTSGQIIGRVMETISTPGSTTILLYPEVQATTSGGGGGGGGTSFDPFDTSTFWFRDDFTFLGPQWSTYSNGNILSGDPPYGDANHPGEVQLSAGSNGLIAQLSFAWNNGSFSMHYPSVFDIRWLIKLGNLTGGVSYKFGMYGAGDHNDFGIVYDSTVGPNWQASFKNNDTVTFNDMGIAANTANWVTLRIRSDGTKLYFSVNGTEISYCTSGCNVTTATGLGVGAQITPYFYAQSSGGSADMACDFFGMVISGLTR